MLIPDKAIIKTPTRKEAQRLLSFLQEHGYVWSHGESLIQRDHWEDYEQDTAYDLEPGKRVQYCSVEWYEDIIDDYFSGRETDEDATQWIPIDSALRLCTVDAFFAICLEDEFDDCSSIADPADIL